MSFISYAQNFEDVILWRALKHVAQGFYIDIGAAWPDEHSVTKAFYDKGWSGINVEPNPSFFSSLERERRRDTNLRVAVGDHHARASLNLLADTGLSTLIGAIAEQHQRSGLTVERQEVDVVTLASLWETHVAAKQDVHFLKVDVEGMEEAVLRGNDWTENRPWVIVVEATYPLSQTASHNTWEPILLRASYRFAYSDGLNRFYIAEEHPELLPSFAFPPNVFDSFVLASQHNAEARAILAEQQLRNAEAELRNAEAELREAKSALHAVYASRSWRITAPVRALAQIFRRLKNG